MGPVRSAGMQRAWSDVVAPLSAKKEYRPVLLQYDDSSLQVPQLSYGHTGESKIVSVENQEFRHTKHNPCRASLQLESSKIPNAAFSAIRPDRQVRLEQLAVACNSEEMLVLDPFGRLKGFVQP